MARLRKGNYFPELVVLLCFIFSRLAYYAAGIRFQSFPITQYWQFIDTKLMRSDLARTLWYLHMQPPGFNLLIGVIVKLFPHSYPLVCEILYIGIGLGIAFSLLKLGKLFGIPAWLRTITAALLVISPGVVLYENFVLYEYPVLLLLLLAAIALFRLVESPSTGRSVLFFIYLLALVLIRNQFHLLWLCLITAALVWCLADVRRTILVGALPCLAVVVSLYLKNWMLFGAFTASTWLGMNAGVVTTFQLSEQEADRLIAQGVVSPNARITPFSAWTAYEHLVATPSKTGIPVLDDVATSDGHPNFNALAYLSVHEMYLRDAKAVLLHYPKAYLRSCMIAWFAYFLPASDLHTFDELRRTIRPLDKIFSAVFFGQFRQADSRKELRALNASGHALSIVLYTGMFLMVLLPLLFLHGAAQIFSPTLR